MGIFQNLAVTGLFRQERRHELIANNLSNAQTAGFKKDVPVFHKIFSEAISSSPLGEFETSVTSFQQGETAVRSVSTMKLPTSVLEEFWKALRANSRISSRREGCRLYAFLSRFAACG